VRGPVTPTYDRVRFTDPVDIAFLPPMLDMMDVPVYPFEIPRNFGQQKMSLPQWAPQFYCASGGKIARKCCNAIRAA
jgi:hypothetical protein